MPDENDPVSIAFSYPFPEEKVFRYRAMQDVLSVLVDDHLAEFTVGELAEMVDANQATVSKAVRLLVAVDAVTTRQQGRRRYVSVNRDNLTKPDPVLAVPQSEFHRPVRAFVDRVRAEVDDLVGVVLFGSVARGTADRASDVDVLVVVRGEERTAARRTVQAIVSDLEETPFDGDRYSYQALVESVGSVRRIGDRMQEQFEDGITLVGSETLTDLRKEVYGRAE